MAWSNTGAASGQLARRAPLSFGIAILFPVAGSLRLLLLASSANQLPFAPLHLKPGAAKAKSRTRGTISLYQKIVALCVQAGPRLHPYYSRPSTNPRLSSCSTLLPVQHRFHTQTSPLSISGLRQQNSACLSHTNRLRLACSHSCVPLMEPQPSQRCCILIAGKRCSPMTRAQITQLVASSMHFSLQCSGIFFQCSVLLYPCRQAVPWSHRSPIHCYLPRVARTAWHA